MQNVSVSALSLLYINISFVYFFNGGTMSQARPRAIRNKQTKSQILSAVADETDLTKKQEIHVHLI